MPEPKILIIEDDPDVRLGLAIRLRSQHYQVFFAGDASTGLREFSRVPPDLVILDLGLPGEDGYAVLNRIRGSAQLATTPVLVLSAWDRNAHEARARQAGASAFCQKPVDNSELLVRIRQLLPPFHQGSGAPKTHASSGD